MKVKELIARLAKQDPEKEVMILDGNNGGGVVREINLGPTEHKVTVEDITESADAEDLGGETVIVLGYGNY